MDKKADKPITTIFFDFGKTLHDFNLDPFFIWLAKKCYLPRRKLWGIFGNYPDGLIFPYECGQETKDFLDKFRQKCIELYRADRLEKKISAYRLPKFSDEEFITKWCEILDPSPASKDRIEFLDRLKRKGYKLYILSNSNPLHRDYIKSTPRFRKLLSFFEHFIASCDADIMCRKTKMFADGSNRNECETIFNKALAISGSFLKTTLYIDDVADYVSVFRAMGGYGIHHRGSWTQIEAEFYKLGLKW